MMLAHGFGIGTLHDFGSQRARDCGAADHARGRRLIEVTWLTTTEAGRRALSE
jgi:hypothetical protein